uniref:Uncharacterized protein n=1 Tax=Siphoviridae sp. ctk4d14 TaxID=2825639 RepID=A0A8S5QKQ3_9CAUD|nr:MAG TPA: hypothetical protein [Siphoviridae sp. ctk4d14]
MNLTVKFESSTKYAICGTVICYGNRTLIIVINTHSR